MWFDSSFELIIKRYASSDRLFSKHFNKANCKALHWHIQSYGYFKDEK